MAPALQKRKLRLKVFTGSPNVTRQSSRSGFQSQICPSEAWVPSCAPYCFPACSVRCLRPPQRTHRCVPDWRRLGNTALASLQGLTQLLPLPPPLRHQPCWFPCRPLSFVLWPTCSPGYPIPSTPGPQLPKSQPPTVFHKDTRQP